VSKRFLVTTAIEETIPKNEPILFLGEWCRPFKNINKLDKLNAKVLPYHWDDRSKLYKDFLYLNEFNEKLLIELTHQLNQMHGTDHKVKYWRIFLGPWLGYFIQITFDKWSSIQSAIKKFDLIGSYVQSYKEDLIVPSNMRHFTGLLRGEEWNHFIYSYILKNYTKVECFKQKSKYNGIQEKTVHELKINRRIKKKILDYLNLIILPFQKKNDALFINSYLSKKDQILLSLKLLQAPIHHIDNYLDNFDIKIDQEKRKWKLDGTSHNEFEVFVRSIISKQIPIVYLEGYNFLSKKVSSLSWPSQPKFIFTGSSFMQDDLFKLYAAQKTENGCPLVISQHGGGYGSYLFAFNEHHGFKISDLFLSWGWTDKSNPNIKSVGLIKEKKSVSTKHKYKNRALLVVGNGPNHSYHLWSAPISSNQWISYFNDQCAFIDSLDPQIQELLIIRLKNMVKGFEPSYDRWVNKFPKIMIDEGNSKIDNLITKSKIYIGTYNASTSVECFALGIPVVIYWSSNYWEIKDSAKVYFDKLKKVGVFHDTPESAASHINLIWHDVNSWWNSVDVKDAVNSFKNNYCYEPPKLVDSIFLAIHKVIKTSNK
jgi:putative transferase (TIGR04331 family)